MGFLDIIHSFVNGTSVGFIVALFVVFYVLSSKTRSDSHIEESSGADRDNEFKERAPPEETLDLLRAAIAYLHNAQRGRPHANDSEGTALEKESNGQHHLTPQQLEKQFIDKSKDLRDRWKQLKALSYFVNELGKTYGSFSKDLMKLSSSARANVSNTHSYDEEGFSDDWWRALSLACDSLSSDREHTAGYLCNQVYEKLSSMYEEAAAAEKRLTAEGNRLIAKLSDSITEQEQRLKERDKYREKVLASADKSASAGLIIGGTDSKTIAKLQIREIALLEQTDKVQECIKEYMALMPKVVAECKELSMKTAIEAQTLLVKVADAVGKGHLRSESVTQRLKSQIVASQVPGTTYGAAAGVKNGTGLQGFEENLQHVLENQADAVLAEIAAQQNDHTATSSSATAVNATLVAEVVDVNGSGAGASTVQMAMATATGTVAAAASVGGGGAVSSAAASTSSAGGTIRPGLQNPAAKLDMSLESTACLAAVSPDSLPELPASFGDAIGTETAVWFNALSGRVYRDAARSEYFHGWLCDKLTTQLNKGKRPGYIDQVRVEEVTFGALPPLLCNIKWTPLAKSVKRREEASHSSAVKPEKRGSSGATEDPIPGSPPRSRSRKKENGKDDDDNDEEEEGNDDDKTDDEAVDVAEGSTKDGTNTHEADAAAETPSNMGQCSSDSVDIPLPGGTSGEISRIVPKAKRRMSEESQNTDGGKEQEEDEASDYDVECTADLAFRSGMKFKLTTKIWWNWPRDRYASVPITLMVDVVEICGRIRFGVTRSHSFVSFLGMPQTRFSVDSEIGDRFKLKNVPKLSEFIIKKMKKAILTKLVHPNSHKLRLIWPRNWWPEGTKHLFQSTSKFSGVAFVGDDGKVQPASSDAQQQQSATDVPEKGASREDSKSASEQQATSAAGMSVSRKIARRASKRGAASGSSGKAMMAGVGGSSAAPSPSSSASVSTVHGAMQWLKKKSFNFMSQAKAAGVTGREPASATATTTINASSAVGTGGLLARSTSQFMRDDKYHGIGVKGNDEEDSGDDGEDVVEEGDYESEGGESIDNESEHGQPKGDKPNGEGVKRTAVPASVSSTTAAAAATATGLTATDHAAVMAMLHLDSSQNILLDGCVGAVEDVTSSSKNGVALQIDISASVSSSYAVEPDTAASPLAAVDARGRNRSSSPLLVSAPTTSSTPVVFAVQSSASLSPSSSTTTASTAKSVTALAASAVDMMEEKLRAAFGRPRRATLPDDINVYTPCDILADTVGEIDTASHYDTVIPSFGDSSAAGVGAVNASDNNAASSSLEVPSMGSASVDPSKTSLSSTSVASLFAPAEDGETTGSPHSPTTSSMTIPHLEIPKPNTSSPRRRSRYSQNDGSGAESDTGASYHSAREDISPSSRSGSIPRPTHRRNRSHSIGDPMEVLMAPLTENELAPRVLSTSASTSAAFSSPAVRRRSLGTGNSPERRNSRAQPLGEGTTSELSPPPTQRTPAAPIDANEGASSTTRDQRSKSQQAKDHQKDLHEWVLKSQEMFKQQSSSLTAKLANFKSKALASLTASHSSTAASPIPSAREAKVDTAGLKSARTNQPSSPMASRKEASNAATAPTTPPPPAFSPISQRTLSAIAASVSASVSESLRLSKSTSNDAEPLSATSTAGCSLLDGGGAADELRPALLHSSSSSSTGMLMFGSRSRGLSISESLSDALRWGKDDGTRKESSSGKSESGSKVPVDEVPQDHYKDVARDMERKEAIITEAAVADVSVADTAAKQDEDTTSFFFDRVAVDKEAEEEDEEEEEDADDDELQDDENEEDDDDDSNNGFYRFDGEAMMRYRSRVRLYRGRSVSDAPMALFATAASIFPNSVPEDGRSRSNTGEDYAAGDASGGGVEGFDASREFISAHEDGFKEQLQFTFNRRLSCGSSDFMDRGLSTACDRGESLGAPWHEDMVQMVPVTDQDIINAASPSPGTMELPQALQRGASGRRNVIPADGKKSTKRGDELSMRRTTSENKKATDVRAKVTRFAEGTTEISSGAGDLHHRSSHSRERTSIRRTDTRDSLESPSHSGRTGGEDKGKGFFPSRTAIVSMIKSTAAKKGSSFLRTINNAMLQPQERRYREFKRRQQKLKEKAEREERRQTHAQTQSLPTLESPISREISDDYVVIRPRASSAPVTSLSHSGDVPVSSISVVSEVQSHEGFSLTGHAAPTDAGQNYTAPHYEVISSERSAIPTSESMGNMSTTSNESDNSPPAIPPNSAAIGAEIVSKILEGQVTEGIREAIHAVSQGSASPLSTSRRTTRSSSCPQAHEREPTDSFHAQTTTTTNIDKSSVPSTPLSAILSPGLVPMPAPLFSSLTPCKLPASAVGTAVVRSGYLMTPSPDGERVFLELTEGRRVGGSGSSSRRESATLRVYACGSTDTESSNINDGAIGDDDRNSFPIPAKPTPKRTLVAVYELTGAECRPSSFAAAAALNDVNPGVLQLVRNSSGNRPFKDHHSGSERGTGADSRSKEEEDGEGEGEAGSGFEISFRSAKGKWLSFWCDSDEDCGEWMDAFDLVALSDS